MKEILIASKNPGKVREYRAMLEPLGYSVRSLLDFPDFPDIPENGSTFSENARLKAAAVSGRFHMPCLADDSGLEVDALGGRPGVFSQRYSPEGTASANRIKLLAEMQGRANRKARFVCVIVFQAEGEVPREFRGTCDGEILTAPRGINGFGYDPLFFLPESGKTMAELPESEKNRISHRGKALKGLLDSLREPGR